MKRYLIPVVVILLMQLPYHTLSAISMTIFTNPDFEDDPCSEGESTTVVYQQSTFCQMGLVAYFFGEPLVRGYYSFVIDCATNTVTLTTSQSCDLSGPGIYTDTLPLAGTCISESDTIAFGNIFCSGK